MKSGRQTVLGEHYVGEGEQNPRIFVQPVPLAGWGEGGGGVRTRETEAEVGWSKCKWKL